ncbi:MAG: GAF domain-containing protein [Fibrobacterota bacterium]
MTPIKRRVLIIVCAAAVYVMVLLVFQLWTGGALSARLRQDRETALLAQTAAFRAGVKKETLPDTAWVRPLFVSLRQACPSLQNIRLLDDKGRVRFSTDPEQRNNAEQNPEAMALLRDGRTGFYPGAGAEEGDLLLLTGFVFSGKTAGGVAFAFDGRDIAETVQVAQFRLRLSLAALFLLAVLAVFFFTERAVAINRELQRGLYLLGSGNFAFQVKGTQLGEAGANFTRFNEAVASLKGREERKNTLLERAKLLGVDMRFDTLFENLMKGAREELSADSMLLLVIKDESLVVGAVWGYDETLVFKEEVYRIQEDTFTEVLEYGRPIFLEDASEIRNNARYGNVLRHSGEVVLFPITLGNEIYGLLHVARASEKGPFKASEVDAGIILCGGAAVAMTHLVERGEVLLSVPGVGSAPITGEYRGEGLVVKTLALPDAAGWTDFFTLENEKRTECLLVAAGGAETASRSRARDRISGMVDAAGRLKSQMGSLSYFALSVLLKMPASAMREKMVAQFKASPFTAEGLRALLRGPSPTAVSSPALEVIRFDAAKRTASVAIERLDLFTVRTGVVTPFTAPKVSFAPGDSLFAVPKGLFTAATLTPMASESDPSRALLLLYDRCQELRKEGKAVDLPFNGMFAAQFTADEA